jgi:hypothetical protein
MSRVIVISAAALLLYWFVGKANEPRVYNPAFNSCLGDQNNMVPLWCVR